MNTEADRGRGPKGIVVVINGTPTVVDDATLTFEELTALAYPSQTSPRMRYTITYRNAADQRGPGVLLADEQIQVKNRGTVFDVNLTTES